MFSIGSVFGDVTFNVGGPVWAMDWCPIPGTLVNNALYFILTVYEPFALSLTVSCQGLGEIIDSALVDPIFKQRSGKHSRAAAHC